MLAESFEGIGNLARQLVLWLEFCGESTSGIESMVEDHVKDLLEEHFDPKKADTIFSEEGIDIFNLHNTFYYYIQCSLTE